MKSDQTIIRKNLMEQLNFITNLLGIKDKNIIILNYLDSKTHKEIIAKLDYPAPKCHNCHGQMAKYDFYRSDIIDIFCKIIDITGIFITSWKQEN